MFSSAPASEGSYFEADERLQLPLEASMVRWYLFRS